MSENTDNGGWTTGGGGSVELIGSGHTGDYYRKEILCDMAKTLALLSEQLNAYTAAGDLSDDTTEGTTDDASA